jgi:CRP-like cAMP-binding protein
MLSNLELIRRVPLFSTLSPAQAEVVGAAVVKRRFRRGEVLVEQGKKSHALFILLSGRARVMTSDSRGREVILATLHPGDYLGEMSLIDHEPHSATVRADLQTDALVLGSEAFAHCLPASGSVADALLIGLVRRLRHADRKIESLALMDVYGRVARALMELAEPQEDGRLLVRDKVSRQDVAKMVGASREMVSRVMKDLQERGFIEPATGHALYLKERINGLV